MNQKCQYQMLYKHETIMYRYLQDILYTGRQMTEVGPEVEE